MSLAPSQRIIGIRLITFDDLEFEPTADVEWSLEIWKADGFGTKDDRVIGAGSLLAPGDRDFRRME